MSSQKSGKGKTWLKALLIVIICVVAAGAVIYICYELRGRNSTDQLADHLAAGQEYMAEGSYARAANEFAAAIEINPAAVSLYSQLADAYIEMNDPVSTYEAYDFALDKIMSEYESRGAVLHGAQDICDKMISYYEARGDSEKAEEVRTRINGIFAEETSGESEPEQAEAEPGESEPEQAEAESGTSEPEQAEAEPGESEPEQAETEYGESIIKIKNVSVTASSQLEGNNIRTYGPELLFDGNLETTYAEGVDGTGEGEEIVIDLDGEYYIREIRCYPGNQLSEYIAEQYGYPTRLTFYFSDGSSRSSGLISEPQPGDSFILLFIGDASVETDSIRIVIESASAGDETSDLGECTCISEIEIYGYRSDTEKEAVPEGDEAWQSLYADYITQNLLGSTDRLYEEFYLAYINEDNIPELITVGNSSPGECSCIYIEEGEVKEIPLSGSVCFWLRNGKFSEEYEEYVGDYDERQKVKVDRVYTLTNNGKLVTEFEGSCDLITDDGEVIGYENYLADGQSVDAGEYEAMLQYACSVDGPYYGTMSVSVDPSQTWRELAEVNTADGVIYSNNPSDDGSELDISQMNLAPTAIEVAARLNSGDIPDIIGR